MTCHRCPAPSVAELDGEPLCRDCATAWVRGEGRAHVEALADPGIETGDMG